MRTYGKETLARKLLAGEAVERDGKISIKQYLAQKEGNVIDTVWEDIESASYLPEKLGYPTQKPESLLERIIKASSNEGDVVLDPFCGCGTTINVAERLHRRWIGIDITHLAITLIKHRLADTFRTELSRYEVVGDPKDLGGARELAAQNRLPSMYTNRLHVEAGGLMCYGPSFSDLWRRAATYVDKILRGATPAELPVEQPTKFELVINLKTAKALGLAVPSSLLARTDEVIE